jgi:hypothetical protein
MLCYRSRVANNANYYKLTRIERNERWNDRIEQNEERTERNDMRNEVQNDRNAMRIERNELECEANWVTVIFSNISHSNLPQSDDEEIGHAPRPHSFLHPITQLSKEATQCVYRLNRRRQIIPHSTSRWYDIYRCTFGIILTVSEPTNKQGCVRSLGNLWIRSLDFSWDSISVHFYAPI